MNAEEVKVSEWEGYQRKDFKLEIIVEDETKRAAALSEIETLLVKLGYTMQDTTRTSYLSMLEEAFPCGNTEVSV